MKKHFTLVELIIATSLLALLVLGAVNLSLASITSYDQIRDRQAHVNELMRIDASLQKLISNSVPFWWYEGDFKMNVFNGKADTLTLVSRNKIRNVKDGGMRFCTFYINDEAEFIVEYQSKPLTDAIDFVEGESLTSVLAQDVEKIEFFYAGIEQLENASQESDSNQPQWFDEWDELRIDLPLAIWVRVTWQNEVVENFMWRTAGNAYQERLGFWQNGVELK